MSIRAPTVPSSGNLVVVLRFFFGISDFYTGEGGFVYSWYEWAKGTQQSALSLVTSMRSKDPWEDEASLEEHANMHTTIRAWEGRQKQAGANVHCHVVSSHTDSLVVGRADDLQLKTMKCLFSPPIQHWYIHVQQTH